MADDIKEKNSKERILSELAKEVLLTGTRADGFNEPKTEPWVLPPEMLKPGGPSPLTRNVVPKKKKS